MPHSRRAAWFVAARLGAVAVTALTASPAWAAIIAIDFTGITSTAEGAYLRETDFLAGTTTYLNGPIYTDTVSGRIVIDTSRLPPLDPFEFEQGHYTFTTSPPAASFAAGQFSSNGYFPVATAGQGATLTYPISPPDFAGVSAADQIDRGSFSSVLDGAGNSLVHQVVDTETRTISLAWGDTLPLTMIDGVSLPDFTKITQAAFGSYSHRNRYVVDQVIAPDGTILSQTQREWTLTHGQSAGMVTALSVQVSGVPEPATWALMLIGFAAVGTALRRHPRTAEA